MAGFSVTACFEQLRAAAFLQFQVWVAETCGYMIEALRICCVFLAQVQVGG